MVLRFALRIEESRDYICRELAKPATLLCSIEERSNYIHRELVEPADLVYSGEA